MNNQITTLKDVYNNTMLKKITPEDFDSGKRKIQHPSMGFIDQFYHEIKEPIGDYNVVIDCIIGGWSLIIYRECPDDSFFNETFTLNFYKDNFKNKEELKIALFKKLNEWF